MATQQWQVPRKHPRVRLVTQVESKSSRAVGLGRTEDISEGGLLIRTPETFDSQSEVTVRFNLPPIPPGRPIETQGLVVHTQPGVSMGIQFLQLDDRNRNAIVGFVQKSCE